MSDCLRKPPAQWSRDGPDRVRTEIEGEPCVWMQARLVAYKLCDLDFDCENCPFDAAMHGALPRPHTSLAQAHPQAASYPTDRRYARGHTWVATVHHGRQRVGLDAFAAGLVCPVGAAILPPSGTRLEPGQPGCWLADECGPLPIRMPLAGHLVGGNQNLRQWPQLTITDPYGEGWLLEMEAEDPDAPHPHLLDAPAMRKLTEEDWMRLKNKIDSYVHTDRDSVGPTLQDGGERLMNLRSIMGAMAYSSLMREFL